MRVIFSLSGNYLFVIVVCVDPKYPFTIVSCLGAIAETSVIGLHDPLRCRVCSGILGILKLTISPEHQPAATI
jgi:hypothetical protein